MSPVFDEFLFSSFFHVNILTTVLLGVVFFRTTYLLLFEVYKSECPFPLQISLALFFEISLLVLPLLEGTP